MRFPLSESKQTHVDDDDDDEDDDDDDDDRDDDTMMVVMMMVMVKIMVVILLMMMMTMTTMMKAIVFLFTFGMFASNFKIIVSQTFDRQSKLNYEFIIKFKLL